VFGAGTATNNIANGFYSLFDLATVYTTCTSVSCPEAVPMTRAGTLQNLHVTATANTTGTFTIIKNGVATTLTCALSANSTCNDTTHSVSIVRGDDIAIQISGAATAKPATYNVEFA
jgi:hypothetical protein